MIESKSHRNLVSILIKRNVFNGFHKKGGHVMITLSRVTNFFGLCLFTGLFLLVSSSTHARSFSSEHEHPPSTGEKKHFSPKQSHEKSFWKLQKQINSLQVQINELSESIGGSAKVYDSNDQLIGRLVGTSGEDASVAFELDDGSLTLLLVSKDDFSTFIRLFTSTDCTGQIYIAVRLDGLFLTSAVSGANNTLYVENGPSQSIDANSFLTPDDVCIQSFFDEAVVKPVDPVLDLDDLFVPPFRVSFE